jgi:hypothetical protein
MAAAAKGVMEEGVVVVVVVVAAAARVVQGVDCQSVALLVRTVEFSGTERALSVATYADGSS